MSYSNRTNQSQFIRLVWFCYAICNNHFTVSKIQWCSNFRFSICTDNSFMIAGFRGNSNAFLKIFDAANLDKMLNRASVQIQAIWECKITEVWLFWFAPSKIYLNKFCKACQQKVLHQIKFILWFSGLKICKDDSYLQKENLFIKTIPLNHVLLLLKNPVTVEWFYQPFQTFAIKVKGI